MERTQISSVQQLTSRIEYALSRGPSRTGLKLKSDRELASLFKVESSKVRASLESLERKGILVRKRGSGTFVRRLASVEKGPSQALEPISAEQLFKDIKAGIEPNGDASAFSANLTFVLWSDLQSGSPNTQRVYGAIARQLNSLGHHVALQTLISDADLGFSDETVAEHLDRSRWDGHLVLSVFAERFEQVMAGRDVPVVYLAMGSHTLLSEPVVQYHTEESTARAVRLLAREGGCRRIGLLALEDEPWHIRHVRPEKIMYDLELQRMGNEYRACGFVPADDLFGGGMQAMRELLDMPERPDGVYVADDNLLPAVCEVLKAENLVPGEDIAIVTLGNQGQPLAGGYDWSVMEFDARDFAQAVVEKLLAMVQQGQGMPSSISIHAHWKPGSTHKLKG